MAAAPQKPIRPLTSLTHGVHFVNGGIPLWISPECDHVTFRDGSAATNNMPSVIICGAHKGNTVYTSCPTYEHYSRARRLWTRGIS